MSNNWNHINMSNNKITFTSVNPFHSSRGWISFKRWMFMKKVPPLSHSTHRWIARYQAWSPDNQCTIFLFFAVKLLHFPDTMRAISHYGKTIRAIEKQVTSKKKRKHSFQKKKQLKLEKKALVSEKESNSFQKKKATKIRKKKVKKNFQTRQNICIFAEQQSRGIHPLTNKKKNGKQEQILRQRRACHPLCSQHHSRSSLQTFGCMDTPSSHPHVWPPPNRLRRQATYLHTPASPSDIRCTWRTVRKPFCAPHGWKVEWLKALSTVCWLKAFRTVVGWLAQNAVCRLRSWEIKKFEKYNPCHSPKKRRVKGFIGLKRMKQKQSVSIRVILKKGWKVESQFSFLFNPLTSPIPSYQTVKKRHF